MTDANGALTPLTVPELISLVEAAVDELVAAEESFTAYDVTTKLRAENPVNDVPHASVRFVVHGIYEAGKMGGYFRYIDTAIQGSPLRYELAVAAVLDDSEDEVEIDEQDEADVEPAGVAQADGIQVGPLGV